MGGYNGEAGELENYLHTDAIAEGMSGIVVAYTDTCDAPLIVAKSVHKSSGSTKPWADVLADAKELGDKVNRAKKRLNRDAAAKMTAARLAEIDAAGEVLAQKDSRDARLMGGSRDITDAATLT